MFFESHPPALSRHPSDFKPLIRGISGRIPWWIKLTCKLVLARLPIAHRHWKRLGLFEHGRMERPRYAIGVWAKHQGALVHNLGGRLPP